MPHVCAVLFRANVGGQTQRAGLALRAQKKSWVPHPRRSGFWNDRVGDCSPDANLGYHPPMLGGLCRITHPVGRVAHHCRTGTTPEGAPLLRESEGWVKTELPVAFGAATPATPILSPCSTLDDNLGSLRAVSALRWLIRVHPFKSVVAFRSWTEEKKGSFHLRNRLRPSRSVSRELW